MDHDHSNHGDHSDHSDHMNHTNMTSFLSTNTTTHRMHSTTTHNMMNHMAQSMYHSMVMHFGNKETVVFYGWDTKNDLDFGFTCFGIFWIAFIYELVKWLRAQLIRKRFLCQSSSKEAIYCINENGVKSRTSKLPYYRKIINLDHILQTFLYCVQVTIAYFLMLVFMIFNWWLCISIILGLTIGFFFFGYLKDLTDIEGDLCGC